MSRPFGSKNRSIEERLRAENASLKAKLKEVQEDHLKDMRIVWSKIKVLQNIQISHSNVLSHLSQTKVKFRDFDSSDGIVRIEAIHLKKRKELRQTRLIS